MKLWTTKDNTPSRYDPNFPYQNPSYIRDAGNEFFGWVKTCVECGRSWSPQLHETHSLGCSHNEEK